MRTQTIQPIEETIKEVDGVSTYLCFFCGKWVENPKSTKTMKKDGKVVGFHTCRSKLCLKNSELFNRGLDY